MRHKHTELDMLFKINEQICFRYYIKNIFNKIYI